MSKPLDRMLAHTPAMDVETPGESEEAGRKVASLWPARENVLRRLEPGPTSGRAEVVPSNVAELESTAILARLSNRSL